MENNLFLKKAKVSSQSVYEELEENPSIMISAPNREPKEFIMTLQDHEKILIQKSLERHSGRRKDAADELGISERTLYRKIKEYKL